MGMNDLRRRGRGWLVGLVAVAVLAILPAAASAAPSDYQSPLFGISFAPNGSMYVADAGQGVVKVTGGVATLFAALPGVTDVAPRPDGSLWAITSNDGATALHLVDADGTVNDVADLDAFEAKRNPHPATIDSNAFDVADLGGGAALVADAGGNDLLKIDKHGKVKLVAVLPDQLVSTANIMSLAGCPGSGAEFCGLPPMMPAEPVATSVAIGPDGAFYVGELKGFPAPTGYSRVWRIAPNAQNAKCGQSPLCTVALDGFTSIIDLAFGPDGRLNVAQIDDASWAAVEIFEGAGAVGGSVHACNLSTKACSTLVDGVPILTSIAYDSSGDLWGSIFALVPGLADVVQLTP